MYIRVYTREADFRKSGMYGEIVRVWANAWDVFRPVPFKVARGRRAVMELFRGVFV